MATGQRWIKFFSAILFDFRILRRRANAVIQGFGGIREHFLLASGAKSCHNWSTSAQGKPSNQNIG
jgi:hypothetical protein